MSSGILKKIWIVGLVVLVVLGLAQIYSGGTDTVVRPAKPTAAPKQTVKLAEPKEQRPFAEASADDPVMRGFPGISWGMTEAELTEKFGRGLGLGSSSALMYRENSPLYGTVTRILNLQDGRLNMIIVTVSKEGGADMLRTLMNLRYGNGIKTSYFQALSGRPAEDPNGDTVAWLTADTVICMQDHQFLYFPRNEGKSESAT